MCGCGRKKNVVTTSVQVEQAAAAARATADRVVSEAEAIVRSAANAIGNTRS